LSKGEGDRGEKAEKVKRRETNVYMKKKEKKKKKTIRKRK
jgi:hypothetical protein